MNPAPLLAALMDRPVLQVGLWLVGLLAVATAIAWLLAWRLGRQNPTVDNLIARIGAWWWLVGVGVPVLAAGPLATTVLFALLSVVVLREFLSQLPAPPHRGDRLAVGAVFLVGIPLQYTLVALDWYGLFSILLPVWGFVALAALGLVGQETDHYLERNARLQWAVVVCVYGLSHAPALLKLPIPGYDASNGLLLLYLLVVAQLSDVFQYVCGKLFGRHKLAPRLSPNKTWEGLVGGGLAACAVGTALHPLTPFGAAGAFGLSVAIVASGFLGGLVLSAVKRSVGAKDWGSLIPGHGGLMDRLDSVALSAPVFFHLTRYFWTP